MIFFLLISKLPFWILYIFSDILYFIAFYVVGYRKKVVMSNLQKSFPDKDIIALKKIRRQFYRHLTDLIVEAIKLLSISEKNLLKRFEIKNIDILKRHLDKGTSIIILTSHQGNWEWLSHVVSIKLAYPIDAIYQPLHNAFFDKLMLKIRQQYTINAVKMKQTLRHVIAHREEVRIIALLADQSPSGSEKDHWTTFFHQESCFFMGGEKIATKMGYPVIFGGAKKVKRGKYVLYFEELATPPFQNLEEGELTERYVQFLEKQISKNPPYWLWSHKRWKRQRPKLAEESIKQF